MNKGNLVKKHKKDKKLNLQQEKMDRGQSLLAKKYEKNCFGSANTKEISLIKGKGIWKVLAASGLAVFMGGMGLFGALGAPANASAASGPDSAAATAGADPYGLDPQNDKVIADLGGLQIKFHNMSSTGKIDSSLNVALKGYPYISMSDGYNYVILGMHSSVLNYAPFRQNVVTDMVQNGTQYDEVDRTPAGNAIVMDYFNLSNVKTSEDIDDDLKEGQILCMSSIARTETSQFHSSNNTTYSTSNLKNNVIDKLYDNFSALEKKFIAPVDLIHHVDDNNTENITNIYVFLFSGTTPLRENFYVSHYLTNQEARLPGKTWWLRSGTSSHTGNSSYRYIRAMNQLGDINVATWNAGINIRPCLVLDLF